MGRLSGTGLRGEADFLRRHNNKVIGRQKKIRTLKIKGLHILFILLMFMASGFAAFKTGEFFLTWDKLDIKSYRLHNVPQYQSQQLRGILKAHGGNIMSLNMNLLRKKLLALKEIKDVALSRRLPSTVEIKFELREPIFQIVTPKGYQIVDNDGVVLWQSPNKMGGLINIEGINYDKLALIIPFLNEISQLKKSIEYVSYEEPYGVVLKLKGIPERFYPGEEEYQKKINYYLKLSQSPILKRDKIINVDLRFNDRIYLEYQEEVNDNNEK